jgi:hypothetical protein
MAEIEKVFKKEVKANGSKMLNIPGQHSVACIVWNVDSHVEISTRHNGNVRLNIDGDLSISDCHRNVRLDFSVDVYGSPDDEQNAQLENVLYKVDTMIEALHEFRAKMKESVDLGVIYNENYKKVSLREDAEIIKVDNYEEVVEEILTRRAAQKAEEEKDDNSSNSQD